MKLVLNKDDIKRIAIRLNKQLLIRIYRQISQQGAEEIIRNILREEMEDRRK